MEFLGGLFHLGMAFLDAFANFPSAAGNDVGNPVLRPYALVEMLMPENTNCTLSFNSGSKTLRRSFTAMPPAPNEDARELGDHIGVEGLMEEDDVPVKLV